MDGLKGLVALRNPVTPSQAGIAVVPDGALFNPVHVEYGAATGPGELDLAPDAMYDTLHARGECGPV